VILCNSDEADDKERRYLRVLEEQRVRGILITPVHGRAPELRRIRERGTPVVLLDRPGSVGQCSVAVDDRRGGELAVSHLLGLGHTSIGTVTGTFRRRVTRSRLHGYEDALRDAGLEPSEDLVAEGDWTPQGGAIATRLLLERSPGLTAIFVHSDVMAIGHSACP